MDESVQGSFRRGLLPMILMALLKRRDMYGYELVQEAARISQSRFTTQEGSLYPVLYRMQEAGLISDRRVLVGKRMTRVYYHLEPKGVERLEKMKQEYLEITKGVCQIILGEEEDEK